MQVSKGDCMNRTIEAIVEASHYPMSIVMVGVGDGPFDECAHLHRSACAWELMWYPICIAQSECLQHDAPVWGKPVTGRAVWTHSHGSESSTLSTALHVQDEEL